MLYSHNVFTELVREAKNSTFQCQQSNRVSLWGDFRFRFRSNESKWDCKGLCCIAEPSQDKPKTHKRHRINKKCLKITNWMRTFESERENHRKVVNLYGITDIDIKIKESF